MEALFVVAIVGIIAMSYVGFVVGKKFANKGSNTGVVEELNSRINQLTSTISSLESTIGDQNAKITSLTAERDVQQSKAEETGKQLEIQRVQSESLRKEDAERHEKALTEQKTAFERQIAILRSDSDAEKKSLQESNTRVVADLKETHKSQLNALEESYTKQLDQVKETADKQTESYKSQIAELKQSSETQLNELKDSYQKQLAQVKENADKQLETLREMNKKQVEDQLALIKEQMRTTSEDVLKARQKELGEKNKEQVSKIIDPLQKSLEDMAKAFNLSKGQQIEALTRLDQSIKLSMEKSVSLGETADRLTRALTGEVKVQGNFGELKLKQLLEDLGLKEREQYSTQETLRDEYGDKAKGDDEKGLIPDFILHFPNNRHVVVDSKMVYNAYERYMNVEDGAPEKSQYLKEHIDSVKAQVKRLAAKGYTKYLPKHYNRLDFAIMYIPLEGAYNLALFNDTTLWKWAYDQGVMILGPQTMYMNLRVLEMMWTQVKQLDNQQAMIDAAENIIARVQEWGDRFLAFEKSIRNTVEKMDSLKTISAPKGQSIITAAKQLIKAGAKESSKKNTKIEALDSIFIESDATPMLAVDNPKITVTTSIED